jgi:hypothetical protein
MKMKKCHLDDISNLIFQGYLTTDIFIKDTFFVIKSLTTEEREEISLRFKYLSKSYNFYLILELLSYSVQVVGGFKVDRKTVKRFLLDCRSIIPIFLFEHYNEIEKRIDECSKFIDYYIDTNESKYYWGIFKNTSRDINFQQIKHVNQFQYYWIVSNSIKDKFEEEKRLWSKTEHMTNTICAFVNPKAYSKMKSKMSITDQLNVNDNKEILQILETTGEVEVEEQKEKTPEGLVDTSQKVFNDIKRNSGESEEDHKKRVNELMKRQCSGEVIDDHDKIVRDFEVNILKANILKKRKETEIYRYIKATKKNQEDNVQVMTEDGILKESSSYLGNDEEVDKLDEELKSKGYFHDGISYHEIFSQRGFCSIPKVEKQKVFDEMMSLKLDIKNEADLFLKNLYSDNNSQEANKTNQIVDPIGNMDLQNKMSLQSSNESTNDDQTSFKNAAQKAANMNVSVQEKDLIKEKSREEKEKKYRIQKMLEVRNQVLKVEEKQSEDLDQMIF